jgi:hypothetical protein
MVFLNVFDSLRNKERIIHLDLLRGFFVFLALSQHYSGYINYWMVYYFRETRETIENYYPAFLDYMGVRIPIDTSAYWLSMIFTPWVSHVYLALAALNLAKRQGEDFDLHFFKRIKIYILLFFFFFFENFIVALNLGDALSFYPLMAWMIILTLIAIVYRYARLKGVFILLLLNYCRFLIPESLSFTDQGISFLQYWIHPEFNYESRVEYFLESGCLGFILGNQLYHGKINRIFAPSIVISFIIITSWYFWGPAITMERLDVYATEHDLAKDWLGMLYLLAVQYLIIIFFLFLEAKGLILNISLFKWIGASSLFIFGLHRVFFVHIAGPIWAWIRGAWLELAPHYNLLEVWAIIAIYLVFCRLIQTSQILRLLQR